MTQLSFNRILLQTLYSVNPVKQQFIYPYTLHINK